MLYTPKKTVDAILDTGNHYVLQVKANQKTLFEEIKRTGSEQSPASTWLEEEKGHGRLTSWKTEVHDATTSYKAPQWKCLQSFIHVHRQQTKKGKITIQDAYFISDLALDAQNFHQGIRDHWGIENRLHWVKDVVHKEDDNGIKKGNAPLNIAIFSTIAINIHRKNGNPSITYGQIKFGSNVKELFRFTRT